MNKARQSILKLLAEGKISVEEAEELLDAISGAHKTPFNDLFSRKHAEREPRHQGRRVEQRDDTRRNFDFDFHFPWDNPDWQWPWEQEGWQWPWEAKHTTISDKKTKPESVSVFEVQEGSQLKIKNRNGNLAIEGTDGSSLNLTSTGSKVSTKDNVISVYSEDTNMEMKVPQKIISVEIAQERGSINIRELSSDLTLRTNEGTLSIIRSDGKIQASLGNGKIFLSEIGSKDVAVKAEKGSIFLEMPSGVTEGSFNLSANNGNISLSLSQDTRCQILAKVNTGNIKHSLPPDAVEIVEKSEGHMNIKFNGGGAEFTLFAGTGNIEINS